MTKTVSQNNKSRRPRKSGSIQKRGDTQRAIITLPDGTRKSSTFKTKTEAERWIRSEQALIDQNQWLKKKESTLADHLQDWLESKNDKAETTKNEYKRIVGYYIIPGLGDVRVQDLDEECIKDFYLDMQEEHGYIMAIHIHRVLRGALNLAIEKKLIHYNPSVSAAHCLKAVKSGEMQFLNEEECQQFLKIASDSRYSALYHLAVKRGLRQGELLGLKWEDIDWKNQLLRVRRQYQSIKVGDQPGYFAKPKSNAGIRTLLLSKDLVQTLQNHYQIQMLEKSQAGDRWQEMDLLFPMEDGSPTQARHLYDDFKRFLNESRVKNIRFHDLRHTAASLMIIHGIPILVASKILGHSDPSITLRVYGHMAVSQQKEASDLMDQLITPGNAYIETDLVFQVPSQKNSDFSFTTP